MSGADKGKQKLEDKYKAAMDALSYRVKMARWWDKISEEDDVLSSLGRSTRYAAADSKQKLEGEDVLYSPDRLVLSAVDIGKQKLKGEGEPADPYGLGQNVLYFRDSIIPPDACKGKQKLEEGSGEGDKLAPNRLTLVWIEICPNKWLPGRVLDEETAKARSIYLPKRKTHYEVPVRLYGGYIYVCIDPRISRSKLNKVYKGHEQEYRDIFETALKQELNYVYYVYTTEESHLTYFYANHHMRQISELMAQYSEYMATNFDSKEIQADPPEADPPDADPPEADPPDADPPEADPPEAEADPHEADPPEAEANPHEADPPEVDPHVCWMLEVCNTGWPRVLANMGVSVVVVVLLVHFGFKYLRED